MPARPGRRRYVVPIIITSLLLGSVVALATLQWRWIGELSALERQRMLASLQESAGRFSADFDHELTRAFLVFHPERGGRGERADRVNRAAAAGEETDPHDAQLSRAAEQFRRWQAEAPEPRLVAALYLVRASEGGVELCKLDPSTSTFVPVAWPAGFERLRERLSDRFGDRPGGDRGARVDDAWDAADLPQGATERAWGLVLPLPGGRAAGDPAARAPGRATRDLLFVELDLPFLRGEYLPGLMQRDFDAVLGADYVIAIVDARHPERIVYRSDPQGPAVEPATADVAMPLFGLRSYDDLRGLWMTRLAPPPSPPPARPGLAWGRLGAGHAEPRTGFAWTLLARRRDGTLESAVAAVRRRNMAVSAGVLGLLAVTALTLAVGAQRAERLARQQLEFVAGVTHELNTPLTAIRSAGENLADGVVHEPAQVRRYGALIETEGRRLSGMVSQVLELAGLEAGRRAVARERVAVAEVVRGALGDCRWLLEQSAVAVETEIAPGLPPVLADAQALRRAVHNLIENAVKYGGAAHWLGIRAATGARGTVEIAVADRGPGVPREETSRIFEPFFRGREAVASGAGGSGLGLNLVQKVVEAHGGTVRVEPGPGGVGSVFRIVLPAAPPAVERAPERAEEPA